MKLFIWHVAIKATDSYHDEGGVVVIAPTIERARELIAETCQADCSALSKEPDVERDCEGPEFIAVHPDAGCC